MIDTTLSAEAIVEPRTHADEDALHALLTRLRRTDPVARVEADSYPPFWLVTRHADTTAVELDPTRYFNARRQAMLATAYESRSTAASGGGVVAAMIEMMGYFQPIIADWRRAPRDEVASVVANAQLDGALLAERDVFGCLLIIAIAGHDTTSDSLAGSLFALLRSPDQMTKLRADLVRLPLAVDEAIRWSTPVRHSTARRSATANWAGSGLRRATC